MTNGQWGTERAPGRSLIGHWSLVIGHWSLRRRGGGSGLVARQGFKPSWEAVDPVSGGFDSHTLPPLRRLSRPVDGTGGTCYNRAVVSPRGSSSAGRASRWQREGQGFESPLLHLATQTAAPALHRSCDRFWVAFLSDARRQPAVRRCAGDCADRALEYQLERRLV